MCVPTTTNERNFVTDLHITTPLDIDPDLTIDIANHLDSIPESQFMDAWDSLDDYRMTYHFPIDFSVTPIIQTVKNIFQSFDPTIIPKVLSFHQDGEGFQVEEDGKDGWMYVCQECGEARNG